jgi:hypothetical protein
MTVAVRLLPRGAGPAQERHYCDRLERAGEIARASGLRYVDAGDQAIACHACGGELLSGWEDGDAAFRHNVTPDRRCGWCGVAVPIAVATAA